MTVDALLAITHHLAAFTVVACLCAELVLLLTPLGAVMVRRLAQVDALYGLAAGLVVAAGISRVVWGLKGSAFYTGNPLFWLKVGVFGAVGLLSIVPTVRFIRWNRALGVDSASLPDAAQVRHTRTLVGVEVVAMVAVPTLAALMARGIGY